MNYIKRSFSKLVRAFQYAKFSWNNEDWDHAFIWQLLGFKLKRVKINLDNGYGVQEPDDSAALMEAIAICERLSSEDEYGLELDSAHAEKWGELKMNFIKIPDSDFSTAKFSYSKATTPELYQQAAKESSNIFDAKYELEKTDLKRIGQILEQHSRKWWN